MRVAAVSWVVQATDSVDEFFDHADQLLQLCEDADLVVFPELPSLELLGGRKDLAPTDEPKYLADRLSSSFWRFGELAAFYRTSLVAGTHFMPSPLGIVNSAIMALPDGSVCADIPKGVLTQYEAQDWRISRGEGLCRLPDPRIGVTVCYDSEFPEACRTLAEAGVTVLCVPSHTETVYGFQRVRWCSLARAVENQVFVLHSSLLGSLGREPVPQTYGNSAVLTPSIPPFPESAVLAETELGVEGAAVADLDFAMLEEARSGGDVRNWHDRNLGDWTVTNATFVAKPRP